MSITHWKTKEGKVLIKDMSTEHLQKAFLFATNKELKLHNAAIKFGQISEALYDEALDRGIELKFPDQMNGTNFKGFYSNTRKWWKSKKEVPEGLPNVDFQKE